MPLTKEEIHKKLDEMGIKYEVTTHKPIHTIDEMRDIEGLQIENVCKDLFLRDEKGRRHFLVVLDESKTADLKALRSQIGSSRLSFASEERLMQHLGVIRGAVTPLGVLNDCARDVEVLFDESLKNRPRLGVHPCENTETLWLSAEDLVRIIESRGNSLKFIKI